MDILLDKVGKHYDSGWVIRNVTYTFLKGSITGIKGKNGSGKSTIRRIISSILTPNEGLVTYTSHQQNIPLDQVPTRITLTAPSVELMEMLSVEETLQFHFKFRKMIKNESIDSILNLIWLTDSRHLLISQLSSGMKQRLKLALAFFTTTDSILLDEPTSNLDEEGIELYNHLLTNFHQHRTIIIASNEERDFDFCKTILDVNQWK